MRERQHAPAAGRAAATAVATLKVKFPEGLALQGEFGGGEPVAAVFSWVADCLSDPLHTYDLVLPSRQALEATRAQSGERRRCAAGGCRGRAAGEGWLCGGGSAALQLCSTSMGLHWVCCHGRMRLRSPPVLRVCAVCCCSARGGPAALHHAALPLDRRLGGGDGTCAGAAARPAAGGAPRAHQLLRA